MIIEVLFYFTLVLSIITTFVSVYNFFTAPRFKNNQNEKGNKALVSILIPARNEEKNISQIIDDVIKQTHKNFELIILDDESEDRTAEIISDKISEHNSNNKIKLISGKPLPNGWLGKNWACHQLSKEASGKYFLFIDADVRLSSGVVESCLFYKDKYKLEMISSFPTQIINSYGEWLIVPLMNFLLLAFLPLKKVYSSANKSFIAANGQFLFIAKSAYEKIGGHLTFKGRVVEDMEIARQVKKSGFNIMTFLGADSVSCRMYDGYRLAYNGFSKNFFPGFNISSLIFTLFLTLIFIVFLLPFLMIFMNSSFVLIVFIILLGRLAISVSSRQNILVNVLLHPVQILIMITIGVNSFYRTKTKNLKWKGRSI
jgi:chlorobactene glucosyltransferase